MDRAFPKLFEAAANGTPISQATLHVCEKDGEGTPYYEIAIKDIKLQRIDEAGPETAAEEKELEAYALKYESAKHTFIETEQNSDKPKGSVEYGWKTIK